MFESFTEGAIKVIMVAQDEARQMGHNYVGTEQILLGLIGQKFGVGAKALKKVNVTIRKTRREVENYIGRGKGFISPDMPFTPKAKQILELASQQANQLGQSFVGTEHILLAILSEKKCLAIKVLRKLKVDITNLRTITLRYIEKSKEESPIPLTSADRYILERERTGTLTPTLDEYASNITQEAIDGKLDPVIGRKEEIDDVISVLARRTKNNPVLIGEPGVGKTAVAEGLAQLIVAEEVPDFLEGSVILSLDIGSILAGTKYRGEFEERLKRIVEEVQNDSSIIVVIDEIHTIIGAGAAEGAVDAANILKPALARGKFRCVGATTSDEYRKYIERDPALERRFQPVHVEEPSVGTTIEILRGLRSKFEQHHLLTYTDTAIEQAVILANKYIADRFLPDKAIDVLDESGARVRLKNKNLPSALKNLLQELQTILKEKENCIKENDFKTAQQYLTHEMEVRSHIQIMKESSLNFDNQNLEINNDGNEDDDSLSIDNNFDLDNNMVSRRIDQVTEADVTQVIANWTGIPVNKLTDSESERLLKMEDTLHERIIGQHHAVVAVSKAIRRARVGLRNPNRPIASFIFAGPTGVGKTELTKTLSDFMFGSEDSMIRLDMSEYMEKHTVAKLIGSPPGYVGYNEGGQLTEAVRSKPYSVILFDEVEKAHPDVFNLLLQILDDGRLSDSKGRVVDFTNTLIIMTTNLGSKIIETESGIKAKSENAEKSFKLISDLVNEWDSKAETTKDPEIYERVKKLVNEELKNFFRPEFLNRIDEIIVFSHLTQIDTWQICNLMIKSLEKRLSEKKIDLIVDTSARAFLTEKGYDPLYGARPLRRAIMKYLEDTLAEQCLSTTLHPGTKIFVQRKKVDGSKIVYTNELEIRIDSTNVNPKLLAGVTNQLEKTNEIDSEKDRNELIKKEGKNLRSLEETFGVDNRLS